MRRFPSASVAATAVGALALTALSASPALAVDPVPKVVINEFSINHDGVDTEEYVEVLSTPATDLSAYRVLEIEGDTAATPPLGLVDEVIALPAADADGRSTAILRDDALENGTVSLLLITGTIPAAGSDIDTNNDGVIDDGLGFTVLDAIAVTDGTSGDRTYGGTTLLQNFDGGSNTVGGASRIPDGTDTDAPGDWVRNDFHLAGIPGYAGTLVEGEAVNTPGAANALTLPPPPPLPAGCELQHQSIGSVQGSGTASPVAGTQVRVSGTVVGDFQQAGGFDGFYLQDGGDGDTATSDGIFVYTPGGPEVGIGQALSVTGFVSEFNGLTQITRGDLKVCATGAVIPEPVELRLPATPAQREALEGMSVTLPQSLAILEYFEFGRFGTIDVGLDRQYQPTSVYAPTDPRALQLAAQNLAQRITIDDGRHAQNPDPAIHPNGQDFTLTNTFRGGDLVTDVTGVLDYRFGTYGIQPTTGATFTAVNPRPEVPDVGGDVVVSSFNVLNYFTTIDPTPADSSDDDLTRGADSSAELDRQEGKIVSALAAIDADVFGLIEIENNGDVALQRLTDALNTEVGPGTYSYVSTGKVGTDAITTALVYKVSAVRPAGAFALMTEAVNPDWEDDYHRPALAQTFESVASGEKFTVVVNHLKSKGSECTGDADPLQGNCNLARTKGANALAQWLAGDPTKQGTAGRDLIIGDLNSYAMEDPITALKNAGYTDLLRHFDAEDDAYSYVFDGQLGYLDHALAAPGLLEDVTGAAPWNINADEPSLIDYDMSFKQPAQDALWARNPYRSSDHDPVVVGLDLTPPDVTPPTITAVADPAVIDKPNNKTVTVHLDVDADDAAGDVTVALTAVDAEGKKASVTQVDGYTFEIRAASGTSYSFTYTATDAAGNTATATATVLVGKKAPS